MKAKKNHPAAGVLAVLRAHGIADESQCQALGEQAPLAPWVAALQAFGAWLAALLVGAAVLGGGLLAGVPQLFAALLIGAALWLFSTHRDSVFGSQMALGLSLAGQSLLVFAVFDKNQNHLLLNTLVALALAAWPRTSGLHRVACLVGAIWCIYHDFFQYRLVLLALFLSALAISLWLARRHWAVWPQAGYAAALAHASTLVALVALWMLHGNAFTPRGWFSHLYAGADYYRFGAALLWLACAAWLAHALPARQRMPLLGVALLLAIVGHRAPALLLSLALMLATFHACARAWFAATLLAAALFLALFYYSLEQTLLLKSATLAACGLALLGLGWLARRLQRNLALQAREAA